jgi:5-methylthioribose kinase
MRCIFVRSQLHLTDEQLPGYLRSLGLIRGESTVKVETAGDGNINWVRRATIEGNERRSFIVKQARPALEKFPEYEAPTQRLAFEARWFELSAPHDPGEICPRIDHFDPENRVLIMEDLGGAERLDLALARGADVTAPIAALAAFLGRVHAATAGDDSLVCQFENQAMQRLHGDHIFSLPYQEEFPCPPETARRAEQTRQDPALAKIAADAYARYLTPSGALVHADVQAGNILLGESGPKLLDAEIAHVGDPAFDLGTLVAHLALPSVARDEADSCRPTVAEVGAAYQAASTKDARPKATDVMRYAGLELVRRTIGAARVPAVESDQAGLRVLDVGTSWMRSPDPGWLER